MNQTAEQLEDELLSHVRALSRPQQVQVLNKARSLRGLTPRGMPGIEMRQFAGLFEPEDIREMAQAIEEECERIDPDRDAHFSYIDHLPVEAWT